MTAPDWDCGPKRAGPIFVVCSTSFQNSERTEPDNLVSYPSKALIVSCLFGGNWVSRLSVPWRFFSSGQQFTVTHTDEVRLYGPWRQLWYTAFLVAFVEPVEVTEQKVMSLTVHYSSPFRTCLVYSVAATARSKVTFISECPREDCTARMDTCLLAWQGNVTHVADSVESYWSYLGSHTHTHTHARARE